MKHRLVLALLFGALFVRAGNLQEYNRAWLLLGQGRHAEAIDAAKAIITKNAGFFRAYRLIATASVEAHTPAASESYFRELSKSDTSNPWPYYGLGYSQQVQGKLTVARQHYENCVKRSKDAFWCYTELGSTFDDQRSLARALPAGPDFLCRMLARANSFAVARRLPEAIGLVRKSLTILENEPNVELNAFLHEQLANFLLLRNRDYGESLADLEFAFSAWTRLDDWEAQERVVEQILSALLQAGQYAAIPPWEEKFRGLIRERPSLRSESDFLGSLASVRLASGDPDGALTIRLKQKQLLESLDLRVDQLLLTIGSLYNRRGDFEAALKCYLQAWDLSTRDVDRAYVLRTIGVLYAGHGDYFKALEYGRRSIDLFRKLKMYLQAGAGQRNIAEVYALLGDFTEASRLVLDALDSARLRHDTGEEQGCRAALGELYSQMGRTQESLRELKVALVLSGHTSYVTARAETLLSLSGVYRQAGEMGQALDRAIDGLAAAKSIASPALEAQALIEVADLRMEIGEAPAASAGFDSALEIARKIDSPDLLIAAHRGLAELSLKGARYGNAVTHLEHSVDNLEAMRGTAPGAELRSAFVSQNWRVYEDLLFALSSMHDDRKAFDYSERGRARVFLDTLNDADAAKLRKQGSLPIWPRLNAKCGRRALSYLTMRSVIDAPICGLFPAIAPRCFGCLEDPKSQRRSRHIVTRFRRRRAPKITTIATKPDSCMNCCADPPQRSCGTHPR